MSRHSRALAGLTLVIAVGVGGLVLTRQMIAVAGEADAERLNRSILQYVALKNPQAPIKAFQRFPEVLVAEAHKSNLDHCLVLAQAEVESEFKHDAVGAAGEIGIFQVLPSTAALMEPIVGRLKRASMTKNGRDLGDLRSSHQHPRRHGVPARYPVAQAECPRRAHGVQRRSRRTTPALLPDGHGRLRGNSRALRAPLPLPRDAEADTGSHHPAHARVARSSTGKKRPRAVATTRRARNSSRLPSTST